MSFHGTECIECIISFKTLHQIRWTWIEVAFISTSVNGLRKFRKTLNKRRIKFGWRMLRLTSWLCYSTGFVQKLTIQSLLWLWRNFRFYPLCVFICTMTIPTLVPIILFNEAPHVAFLVNMFRWLCTWTQFSISNAFLHMFGYRPHDKNITARNHWIWQIMWAFDVQNIAISNDFRLLSVSLVKVCRHMLTFNPFFPLLTYHRWSQLSSYLPLRLQIFGA